MTMTGIKEARSVTMNPNQDGRGHLSVTKFQ